MIPKSTIIAVIERSGGICEAPGCRHVAEVFAHIVHRGMGGRKGEAKKMIHDPRNVAHLCILHHDILDWRIFEQVIRAIILAALKIKLGWPSWAEEARAKGINIGRIE
jgi:hypothetical protein